MIHMGNGVGRVAEGGRGTAPSWGDGQYRSVLQVMGVLRTQVMGILTSGRRAAIGQVYTYTMMCVDGSGTWAGGPSRGRGRAGSVC